MATHRLSHGPLSDEGALYRATERAYDMVFKGPVEFFILKAALDLGIFEALAPAPLSLGALAEATGTLPPRLERLLLSMELVGLVEPAGDGWAITPFAAQFFTDAEGHRNLTMLPFAEYMASQTLAYYASLAEVARGRQDFTSHVPYPPRTPEESHFYETLHRSNTHFVQRLLCDRARLDGAGHLIDVGGGVGDIAAALCERHPQLAVTLINLPSAVGLVQENVAARGLAGRITPLVLDLYKEPYPRGDAVLFSRILYPMNAQLSTVLLRKAFEALAPGGRVLVVDMIISDRDNPNYDYLSHYLCGVGMAFSVLDFKDHALYPALLEQVGFRDVSFDQAFGHVLYQAVRP
jgi:bacteriochlorophyll C20 methyltransferase